MTEQWRDVAGWEGLYQVSDHGRVRNVRTTDCLGRDRIGQVLTPVATKSGHLRVKLSDAPRLQRRSVHVLVLETFVGPCPPGKECCHWDGDPSNNYVGNLRWDTHLANETDKRRHGTRDNGRSRRTHCRRRHSLVVPNLVASAFRQGRRLCLACDRTHSFVRTHPEADFQTESDRRYALIMEGVVQPEILGTNPDSG